MQNQTKRQTCYPLIHPTSLLAALVLPYSNLKEIPSLLIVQGNENALARAAIQASTSNRVGVSATAEGDAEPGAADATKMIQRASFIVAIQATSTPN